MHKLFLAFLSLNFLGNVAAPSAPAQYEVNIENIEQHEEISLLDLDHFISGEENQKQDFINKLGDSLNKSGFVIIKNHQISEEKIQNAYRSAVAFFDLPREIKEQYKEKLLNRGYKGFSPDRKDKKADLQEYWHVGPISPHNSTERFIPHIEKNIWPTEIDTFKTDLSQLYEEVSEKGTPLLKAISIHLGKEETFLSNLTEYGDSIMRVIHYLPSDDLKQEKTWKAPHKDPNLLTVIVGVSKEGLEVQTRDGRWIKVPYHPNTIVVSASNMLESLSNGLIRSAPHRVVIHESNQSRFAIPFFYHVQRNLPVGPDPEILLKTNQQSNYPNQTAEEALEGHQWYKKP